MNASKLAKHVNFRLYSRKSIRQRGREASAEFFSSAALYTLKMNDHHHPHVDMSNVEKKDARDNVKVVHFTEEQ